MADSAHYLFNGLFLFTFTRFAGDNTQEAEQADLIHGQAGVGPCRVQAAAGTALLSGHPSHQHHVAPLFLTLLQPAHPGWLRRQKQVREKFVEAHESQFRDA